MLSHKYNFHKNIYLITYKYEHIMLILITQNINIEFKLYTFSDTNYEFDIYMYNNYYTYLNIF